MSAMISSKVCSRGWPAKCTMASQPRTAAMRRRLVGEVAPHELLVRRGVAHVADVDEPQPVGEGREAAAQVAAEAAGGAGDQDALVVGHAPHSRCAAARMALRVWRGVRLSVSMTSSSTAPVGLASARAKAAGKSAVRVTRSAWVP